MRAMEIPIGYRLLDEDRTGRWPAGRTCLLVIGSSSVLWALIIAGARWLLG